MRIRPDLSVDDEALAAFCRRHGIQRLALFGSVLRDDFTDDSDIDVLVEFAPDRIPGLLHLAELEFELAALIGGHEVELRTYEDLSRLFRDRVQAAAVPLYCRGLPTASESST
jgi:predicted nucleotidyltransferase